MPEELDRLDKDEIKKAMKEALNEWLSKQFAMFGRWTLAGLSSVAFYALVYVWLSSHGWHK